MRSQVISMDFIMTAVVYVFALSVFFYALRSSIATEQPDLNVPAELVFTRLENLNETIDFLDGGIVHESSLIDFEDQQNGEIFFEEFNDRRFEIMDYCMYLEDSSGTIIRNIRWRGYPTTSAYTITLQQGVDIDACGTAYDDQYTFIKCNIPDAEVLLLTKPVVFDGTNPNEIMKLNVLICAK